MKPSLPKGFIDCSLPNMGVELVDVFVAGTLGSLLLQPNEFMPSRNDDEAIELVVRQGVGVKVGDAASMGE